MSDTDQDQELRNVLLDNTHRDHNKAWHEITRTVRRILYSRGLIPDYAVVSDEDIIQEALKELHRALPTYRGDSKLSTWAYAVVTQRARKYIDYLEAGIRDERRKIPIREHPDDEELPVLQSWDMSDSNMVEEEAHYQVLLSLVHDILAAQTDTRIKHVFMLHVQGHTLQSISEQISQQYQPTSIWQVRSMLDKARELLCQISAIQKWREDMDSVP